LPGVNPWHGLKMTDVMLTRSAKACNHADTICQGLSQGLCQERICQELKPWQGHLRWADLLVILLLANVQLPRLFSILPGLLPLAKCNISCSEVSVTISDFSCFVFLFGFEGIGLVPPSFVHTFSLLLILLRIRKAVEDGSCCWVPT